MRNVVDFVMCAVGAGLIVYADGDKAYLWGGIMMIAGAVRAWETDGTVVTVRVKWRRCLEHPWYTGARPTATVSGRRPCTCQRVYDAMHPRRFAPSTRSTVQP